MARSAWFAEFATMASRFAFFIMLILNFPFNLLEFWTVPWVLKDLDEETHFLSLAELTIVYPVYLRVLSYQFT